MTKLFKGTPSNNTLAVFFSLIGIPFSPFPRLLLSVHYAADFILVKIKMRT